MVTTSHYPSLFVTMNTHEAVWYRINERSTEKIRDASLKKESYTDHEGFFASSGRGVSMSGGEPDVVTRLRDEEERVNMRGLVKQTAEIWKQEKFVHLVCAAPKQLKNLAAKELKKLLPSVPAKYVYGNYTYETKKRIRELFQESLKAVE